MPHTILDEAAKRTARSWNADGIQDLALGSFFLLLGALSGVPYLLPQAASLAWRIPLLVLLVAAGLVIGRVIWAAKQAVTFPRGGYAMPRRPSQRKVFLHSAIVGLLTGCLGGWISTGKPLGATLWSSAIAGAAIGALYVLIGCGGAWRIVALTLAAAVAVAARRFFALPPAAAASLGLAALGLATALAGASALLRYIRRHPVAADGAPQ